MPDESNANLWKWVLMTIMFEAAAKECESTGSGPIKIVFAYFIARFLGKINIFENLINAATCKPPAPTPFPAAFQLEA
jgi:hypothetical protein